METVADFAAEFLRRAQTGKKSSVYVSKAHAPTFLAALARDGVEFAKECLASISDPELRKIIETIFFSTVAGAAAGAGLGLLLAGPPGAQVGAVVGAGLGFAAGCVALTLRASQRGDGLVLSIA
jgi:hypothetical protein